MRFRVPRANLQPLNRCQKKKQQQQRQQLRLWLQLTANKNVYFGCAGAKVKFFNFSYLGSGIGLGSLELTQDCQAGSCRDSSKFTHAACSAGAGFGQGQGRVLHDSVRQSVAELIRCHAPCCVKRKKTRLRTVVAAPFAAKQMCESN